MYNIDKIKWAEMLGISIRTLDRYIRKGRIRSQKIKKKVYLHNEDIKILMQWWLQENYEIINKNNNSSIINKQSFWTNYQQLYESSIKTIEKKDEIIQDLSYKIGNLQSDLKNSISLLEYKKATFLLESSKIKTEEEQKMLNTNIQKLKISLKNQEFINVILIVSLFFVLIWAFLIWFSNI